MVREEFTAKVGGPSGRSLLVPAALPGAGPAGPAARAGEFAQQPAGAGQENAKAICLPGPVVLPPPPLSRGMTIKPGPVRDGCASGSGTRALRDPGTPGWIGNTRWRRGRGGRGQSGKGQSGKGKGAGCGMTGRSLAGVAAVPGWLACARGGGARVARACPWRPCPRTPSPGGDHPAKNTAVISGHAVDPGREDARLGYAVTQSDARQPWPASPGGRALRSPGCDTCGNEMAPDQTDGQPGPMAPARGGRPGGPASPWRSRPAVPLPG